MLLIDTDAIESTLEQVPWVERARVETHFPHTVVIDIRERRPLACFRGGDGKWRVIDVQGRVVAFSGRILPDPQTGVVDETGRIYVTDASRQAVFVFDEAAGELQVWDKADGLAPFLSPASVPMQARSR